MTIGEDEAVRSRHGLLIIAHVPQRRRSKLRSVGELNTDSLF
jgi:hypothetical protein